jgi:hypothetical protein
MKYVCVAIIMVACFALGGSGSTAASTATAATVAATTAPAADPAVADDGDAAITCGYAVCAKGTHCCNASCSRCVPLGMECTQESCD